MVGGELRICQRDGASRTGPVENTSARSVDLDLRSRNNNRITRSQTKRLQGLNFSFIPNLFHVVCSRYMCILYFCL